MRVLVLGAGALGGYFGERLLRGGADVAFLVRPKRAAQLAERGLVIKEQTGDLITRVKTLTAGGVDGHYDLILLACKAYDLDPAIEAVAPAVGAGTAIFPVLNGVAHVDRLCERFGPTAVIGGYIFTRAELTPDGDIVRPAGVGTEDIAYGELSGEPSQRCEMIRAALVSGGISSRISDHILEEMWAKFCAFTANAAITTLTRARAGEIARAAAGASFVSATFDECARVAAAEGHPPPGNIRNLVLTIFTQPGSGYRPSIASDFEAGRPTEGDHTIGDMVRRAQRHELSAPILQAALCNLQIAEARRDQPIVPG